MMLVRRVAAATLLLALTAGMAAAQGSAKNDSVSYSPRTQTVAGTLPLTSAYTLAISAPTQMNKKSEAALAAGSVATLRVNVVAYPLGSSQGEAAALVSLDDSSMIFYALGETHTTTVRVTASANTTPGDYMYTIQAVGPTGTGWGISNHTLTVTVSRPVVSDTTPPDVKITSPANGDAFTFCSGGTNVPVTISAVDAESIVTAVGGTVNGTAFIIQPFTPAHVVLASGSFLASGIGGYTIGASATSAGGVTEAPAVNITVNYAMSWLPPLSQGRPIHGALPIKFSARDCNGAFVLDESVRVEVWEGATPRASAVYGTGSDSVRISEDDEQYIANFLPPTGNHSYTVKVFFNNYLQASLNVVAQ